MMIGGAVGGLPATVRAPDRASAAWVGGATLAVSTAGSVGALATLRLVAASTRRPPNAAALAAEFVPVARRPSVTLTIVCVPLGAMLAGLIAIPALPAFGWRALFVLGGVFPIVAALVLFWLLPESPRYLAGRPERWEELKRLLRRMGHPVEADATFHSETGPEEQRQTREPLATILEPGYRRDSLALWAAFFSCLLSVYMVFSWLPTILTSATWASVEQRHHIVPPGCGLARSARLSDRRFGSSDNAHNDGSGDRRRHRAEPDVDRRRHPYFRSSRCSRSPAG